LIELGFEVLLPWSSTLGYDLAYYIVEETRSFGFFVHREPRLVRIQVKAAHLSSDGTYLEFHTSTKDYTGKRQGYAGQVEAFAVYSPDTKKVYWVDIRDAPGKKMTLRLEWGRHGIETKPMNWARDYEL
jgi:hypothetical protein